VIFAFTLANWLLSTALAGFERKTLAITERVMRAILGVCVLVPSVTIAGGATAIALGLVALHNLAARKTETSTVKAS